ncbi:butyrophilin subfamily 2 member A2-like isoform X6 [Falco naumanni]|uniref:butyrophilin subfamily 2 member A2-like isoform X6 n=1 Tax=Falco naumanni TaxID=148594 RepID=UPI001ADE6E6D|nr:butyrophilin subfamily 2 member A2-like isoform X6 [Falco naumanni]
MEEVFKMKLILLLSFALLIYILITRWLTGEVLVTVSSEPSVVSVGEQVTLSCQLADSVPFDTSVLWYKLEKGKDAPLCASSSLGGVVDQCQDEERKRMACHWKRRALLLVIQAVQVAEEGTYVCAVNGSVVTKATMHLDVTAIGTKPTLYRDQQEENMCRYTCKSKNWYPKPEVIWTNYGGDMADVEANTNVMWSERDHFMVQSIITVPCDKVDVVCVVQLNKTKASQSGSLNDMTVGGTCAYKGRITGSFVKPKVMWINSQGEDLSSLALTSILQEADNSFAIESSIEIPCAQPPPVFVTAEREHSLQVPQQSESGDFFWVPCLLVLLILAATPCLKIGNSGEKPCVSNVELHGKNEHLRAWNDSTEEHHAEQLKKEIDELRATNGNQKKRIEQQKKEIEFRKARGNSDDIVVDWDTAHPNLSIAGDKKSFTYQSQVQKVTLHEGRFDSSVCVLGSEGFSSGKHYWEVDVGNCSDWDLGVARKSAPRKGRITLSPKEGFWALGLSVKFCWARTDPWTQLEVQENPRKVGVFLNCEEKTLTFFNVTNMSVMFTFQDCAFSEAVYPFFKNSHRESTIRICSVKEE